MSFRDLFPWTYALWRFLSSKPVRISLVSSSSLLLLVMAGFRIESFLLQRKVTSILARMSQLRLDETSLAEFRLLLPELTPAQSPGASLRYGVRYDDTQQGILVRYLWRVWQNDRVEPWLYYWGHRFHRFEAGVEVLNGTVVRVDYSLWIDTNEDHMLYSGAGINVLGLSRAGWRQLGRGSTVTYDDLRPYVEQHASNAPENYVALAFTPDAPDGLKQSAFRVHLTCLWNLSPCKKTKQMLPGIWPPQYAWHDVPFGKVPFPFK